MSLGSLCYKEYLDCLVSVNSSTSSLDSLEQHFQTIVYITDLYLPFFSAVLLIGEPTKWESHLQLLVDLLLTEGVPKSGHAPKSVKEVKQLPVIACNMDLVFMHQACMPRFGHGAFLVCLEALYKVSFGDSFLSKCLLVNYI